MTTRRHRRAAVPKPVVIPESSDIRKVKRLPMFGPGIVHRVPLHLWPAYMEVYHLVINGDLWDQQPKFKPIDAFRPMPPLLVKRTQAEPESAQDLWRCMNCDGQPELLHQAMLQHMREVHEIVTQTAVGTKNLIMHLDGAGFYQSTFEYNINGLIFHRYQHRKK
jgi:hypothetical protein